MPFAVAASSVPILAFAPLFNNWFGLGQPAVQGDDRGRPVLLPGDDQHRPRADERRSGGGGAAALDGRVGDAGLPEAARAELAAVSSSPRCAWRRRWPRSARWSASTSRRRAPAWASTSRRIPRSSTSSDRGRRSCSPARSGSGCTSLVAIVGVAGDALGALEARVELSPNGRSRPPDTSVAGFGVR